MKLKIFNQKRKRKERKPQQYDDWLGVRRIRLQTVN